MHAPPAELLKLLKAFLLMTVSILSISPSYAQDALLDLYESQALNPGPEKQDNFLAERYKLPTEPSSPERLIESEESGESHNASLFFSQQEIQKRSLKIKSIFEELDGRFEPTSRSSEGIFFSNPEEDSLLSPFATEKLFGSAQDESRLEVSAKQSFVAPNNGLVGSVGERRTFQVALKGGKLNQPASAMFEARRLFPDNVNLSLEERKKNWEITLLYFQGTDNSLGELVSGKVDALSYNGVGVNVGRVILRDFQGWPLDLVASIGTLYHHELGDQSDTLQNTFMVKLAWKQFPWNEYVRTRIEAGTGVSYAWSIPMTEQINQDGRSSANLLNYNEINLGLHMQDLTKLFTGREHDFLEDTWLMGGILHRSGAWGFYGDDSNGDPIEGGSNYLWIGLRVYR
jgi:hypothetical protein